MPRQKGYWRHEEDQLTDCLNPQQVLIVGPRSDDSSTPFTVSVDERSGTTPATTTFFRVNYDVNFSFRTPSTHSAQIVIEEDGSGQLVESVFFTQDKADSFIVSAPSGTYLLRVDIEPEHGATYTVSVDECRVDRTERRLVRIERRLDRIERRLDRIEGHGEGPRGDRGGGMAEGSGSRSP
jgi:hypothetical protein